MNTVRAVGDSDIPLVVDVDGTLIKTDLLHEAALQFIARHPLQTWQLAAWLTGGKANLKACLAERIDPGCATIPLRPETLAAIHAAQDQGRPVWLASASSRRWVEPIAERVGGVAGVLASDEQTNLAGSKKASALTAKFGEQGFDYIGDNKVDMPVWALARRAFLVSHSRGFEAAVRRRFPDVQTIAEQGSPLRQHIRAMRVYQWAKNLLVFLPLIAAHSVRDPASLLAAIIAFFAFSFAASSAYIINDLLDLPGDRDHHRKRGRPFAAGELRVTRGLAMAVVLAVAAALLALFLPFRFWLVLGAYVGLTLAYSFYLKRKILVDVIVLGGLYTIRVFGGVAAEQQMASTWLLMFCLFIFLSLATVKRCSELVARQEAGKSAPPGRGYRATDLNVLFPLGAAAGYGAVLVVTLYLSSPEIAALYSHPNRMWLMCPLLLYWISRVLMLSNRGEMHDDPIIFALTDRVSWMTGAIAAVIITASV